MITPRVTYDTFGKLALRIKTLRCYGKNFCVFADGPVTMVKVKGHFWVVDERVCKRAVDTIFCLVITPQVTNDMPLFRKLLSLIGEFPFIPLVRMLKCNLFSVKSTLFCSPLWLQFLSAARERYLACKCPLSMAENIAFFHTQHEKIASNVTFSRTFLFLCKLKSIVNRHNTTILWKLSLFTDIQMEKYTTPNFGHLLALHHVQSQCHTET